ncbi:MAG TPA: hypothetical protein VK249_33520 [Anaerolineales bacterium]|nr:hypothetical protein [Anaerolineales bacterium]
MSTATVTASSIFKSVFPESDWSEVTAADYDEIFQKLTSAGARNATAAAFMRAAKIKLGFHQQYKSGAGWTVLRNITLAPGAKLSETYTLCLISHELFHLQQSIWMRLSVQGELLAWQYQQQTYHELTGKDIGDHGEAYGGTKDYWDQLALLSADSREDLLAAQGLMKKVAPDYRSDCLPLFPLNKEVADFLKQGKFAEAFQVVWNLITCR